MLAALLFGSPAVENELVRRITGVLDQETTQTIREAVERITANRHTSSLTIVISILVLLNGTTGFFRHLKSALNIIGSVPPVAPQ